MSSLATRTMPTSIQAITPTTPACYGVCCAKHGDCSRYAAVETADSSGATTMTIASCSAGSAEFPLFIPRQIECGALREVSA